MSSFIQPSCGLQAAGEQQIGAYYNVVTDNGANWQLRAQVAVHVSSDPSHPGLSAWLRRRPPPGATHESATCFQLAKFVVPGLLFASGFALAQQYPLIDMLCRKVFDKVQARPASSCGKDAASRKDRANRS